LITCPKAVVLGHMKLSHKAIALVFLKKVLLLKVLELLVPAMQAVFSRPEAVCCAIPVWQVRIELDVEKNEKAYQDSTIEPLL